MKWTSAIVLLLVVGALGFGAMLVVTRKPTPPREVLAEVREAMSDPGFDDAAGLRRLERALDDVPATDAALRAELLRTRASIYRDLDVFARATRDLVELASMSEEVDPDLLLEIAESTAAAGDPARALERARAVTERFPATSEAWRLIARLEEESALSTVADARARAELALSSGAAEAAEELIIELAARHPRDPRRADLVFELSQLFSETRASDLDRVLTSLAEPSTEFLRAREAYANALSGLTDPGVIIGTGSALERAGRRDLAITLQVAARVFPGIAADPEAFTALLDDLIRAGRLPEARSLLIDWDWTRGGTAELYRRAGEVFYESGEYRGLVQVAQGLANLGGQTGVSWSAFFRAALPIQNAERARERGDTPGPMGPALDALNRFVRDEGYSEPFFGARNEARFLLARGYRAIGRQDLERIALENALERDPDRSAEAWVHYAEAMAAAKRMVPWAEIERAYAHAMSLDPSRTTELEGRWYAAGETMLRGKGTDLSEIFDYLASYDVATPSTSVGPATMTRIAQEHLAKGRLAKARTAAFAALDDHPGLVPPLDVIIGAKLRDVRGDGRSVAEDIVRRIEAAGVDETVERFLAALPGGALDGELLARAIRAEPRRFGKLAVARWHLERGEAERAGRALAGMGAESAPAPLRLLRAELLLEEDDPDGALAELARIAEPFAGSQRALELRVRALLASGEPGQLEAVLRDLLADGAPATSRDLPIIDLLLEGGRPELARALVDLLDGSPRTRTPAFYRRRLVADVMLTESIGRAAVHESVLRAEPYLQEGSPEIASILLAVEERDWATLRDLGRRIAASEFDASEEESAILALMGERLESGRRSARTLLDARPKDASRALLSGAADAMLGRPIELPEWFGESAAEDLARLMRGSAATSLRDPRGLLAIRLAMGAPGWSPVAAAHIAEAAEATGSTLWAPWLRIELDLARGDSERASERLAALLGAHPRFGPAHDLAVDLAVRRHPSEPLHPEVVTARSNRMRAMTARLVSDRVEVQIAIAGEAARQGKVEFAVGELIPVIREGGPAETQARVMLALLLLRTGEPSFAARHLHAAAAGDLGVYREVALDSLVRSLRLGLARGDRQREPLDRAEALRLLEETVDRYPMDPLLALERLRMEDLGDGERGERARGILRGLRAKADGRSLDDLREGAIEAWVRFLTPIASDVAAELVKRELDLAPGNLRVLRLVGVVARASGEREEALEALRALMAIEPGAETGYALAELLIETGAPAAEVTRVLDVAARLDGGGSTRGGFLAALQKLREGRPGLDRTIDQLAALWSQREASRGELAPVRLGLAYLDALATRGRPADLATISDVALALEAEGVDPFYEAPFLKALRGLARQGAALRQGDGPGKAEDGKVENPTGAPSEEVVEDGGSEREPPAPASDQD